MLEEEWDVARVVAGVNEEAGLLWRPLALVRIVDVAARIQNVSVSEFTKLLMQILKIFLNFSPENLEIIKTKSSF